MKSSISVNGRQYISASRASEITKYSRDYIGQLCRAGKVPATMVVRSWFVDLDALITYKDITERNLRAYNQGAVAAGIGAGSAVAAPVILSSGSSYEYSSDPRPLLPQLQKKESSVVFPSTLKASSPLRSPYVSASRPSRENSPPDTRGTGTRSKAMTMAAFFVLLGASFVSAAFPDATWNMASGAGAAIEKAISSATSGIGSGIASGISSLTGANAGTDLQATDPGIASIDASSMQVAEAAGSSASTDPNVVAHITTNNTASALGSWLSSASQTVATAIRHFLGIGDGTPGANTFVTNNAPATTTSVVYVYRETPAPAPAPTPVVPAPAPAPARVPAAPSIVYVPSSSGVSAGRVSSLENSVALLSDQVGLLQEFDTDQKAYITRVVGESISNAFRGVTLGGSTTVINNSGGGGSGSVTSVDVSGDTTGLTFSGGPITTSGTLTMSGVLGVNNGGTAMASAPVYGELLVGNDSGGYSLMATSTLGLGGSSGTVSSVQASGGTTGLTFSGGPVTTSGTLTLGGKLGVPSGGTGWSSIQSGALLYGNGSSALSTTSAGTAGQVLALLNGVPTWTATTTAGTGLTYSGGAFNVNSSQSISKLSNLAANGFVKTSGGDGTLSIDTATYLTGNQTITLSGDISGSGTTAITTAYNGIVPVNKGGTNISNPTAASVLLGSYAGGGWQQLATSSLGLPTFGDVSTQIAASTFGKAWEISGGVLAPTTTIGVRASGPFFASSTVIADGIVTANSGINSLGSITVTGSSNATGNINAGNNLAASGTLAIAGAGTSTFAGGVSASQVCLSGSPTTCLGGSGGGTGTVTSVATNNGLTGGTITNTGTIGLDLTGISTSNTSLTWNGS
ncbi:MAG: hypothetical protein JWO00_446, partial [Candidatus Parcubacteria bacterium]|nr:hypothetical protein [Candidatus Parcubacteria bacterium]